MCESHALKILSHFSATKFEIVSYNLKILSIKDCVQSYTVHQNGVIIQVIFSIMQLDYFYFINRVAV